MEYAKEKSIKVHNGRGQMAIKTALIQMCQGVGVSLVVYSMYGLSSLLRVKPIFNSPRHLTPASLEWSHEWRPRSAN